MELVRVQPGRPASRQGQVVALGNFDGVHLGHQRLLAVAGQTASATGDARSAVLTFEPHPASVLRPESAPGRLTPLRSKARKLAEAGVDILYIQRFSLAFSSLTADAFMEDVLARTLAARHVVVGHDFRFGTGRAGDAEGLARFAPSAGFGLTVVDPVTDDAGVAFGSTAIRKAISEGRVDEAGQALGAPFEVEGRVRRGETRGRRLGFPTANLLYLSQLAPLDGVYAGWTWIESQPERGWLPAAISTGTRPQFAGTTRILEAHVLDFQGNLYGERVRVAFSRRLRPERKFANSNALISAMSQDVSRTRAIAAEEGPPRDTTS
ncbi:MAG: bifunctional riboflavin kinase/FAD synthetase [Rhodospirillales bacterium]|nr:bifunctional riboflavin kinase/FAD synthetase [Rhodospirillales bacterium]